MLVTKKDRMRKWIINIFFIILSMGILYTFLLILGSSFSSQKAINEYGFSVIPKEFTLEAYARIFQDTETILHSYWITFLTTAIGSGIGLVVTAMMGYVLSRGDYPYRNIVSFYCFFTMLFHGGLVPTYILITNWLGLKNTIWAIILPGTVNVWNMMLMKSYFKSIPVSLIEAAKIDGMGEVGIFTKIVLPLSKPACATIGLFFALAFWNQWYNSMLYSDTRDLVSLQYMLVKIMKSIEFLNSEEAVKMGLLQMGAANIPSNNAKMAMCIVAAGPILVIFPFFQKYFVKGINVGSVKG